VLAARAKNMGQDGIANMLTGIANDERRHKGLLEELSNVFKMYSHTQKPADRIISESEMSSKYGLWDSYFDYGAAVQEANKLRKIGWHARITEAQTPQGRRFRVWTDAQRRKIEEHLPY
jgi:hypothetical protein